jgi:hypothetical protein
MGTPDFITNYTFQLRDGLPPDGEKGTTFLGFDANYRPHLLRWDGRGWVAAFFGPNGHPTASLIVEGAENTFAPMPVIVRWAALPHEGA